MSNIRCRPALGDDALHPSSKASTAQNGFFSLLIDDLGSRHPEKRHAGEFPEKRSVAGRFIVIHSPHNGQSVDLQVTDVSPHPHEMRGRRGRHPTSGPLSSESALIRLKVAFQRPTSPLRSRCVVRRRRWFGGKLRSPKL